MNHSVVAHKIEIPRMLLIAGNGRNVGKTTLACRLIKQLSAIEPVIGIKISAHFHPYNQENVVAEGDSFVILDENQISRKDSSLMLQAGAEKVFFVMAEKESLTEAADKLLELLPHKAIVCESGGLHKIVQPGCFLFVNRKNKEIVKFDLLEYDPLIVENDGNDFDFDISRISIDNQRIKLKV